MAYNEFSIRVPEPFKDSLIQRLSDAGSLGVIENDQSLVAYFPDTCDSTVIANDLLLVKAIIEKAGSAHEFSFDHALIPEQDWNASWKKDFLPVDAGERFTILPPWEEKRAGRINMIIDPAMAFGTGHHETTRSCLVLLEKYAKTGGNTSFLDLGTGTGILAIAASKLGYQHVVGIDTDPLSIEAAGENIKINEVPDIEVRGGSLTEAEGSYDVIAANILSGVLVVLAPALSAHVNPGGIAILSGILIGQEDEVIEAMKQTGLELIEKYPDGKWMSLAVKKPF